MPKLMNQAEIKAWLMKAAKAQQLWKETDCSQTEIVEHPNGNSKFAISSAYDNKKNSL